MVKTLHTVCTLLFIALGVVHVLFTFTFATRLTQGVVWFAGAGLAAVFAGFLNVALGRGAGRDRIVRTLGHVTNALLLIFGTLAVVAVREPQAYVGIVLILVMAATAYRL